VRFEGLTAVVVVVVVVVVVMMMMMMMMKDFWDVTLSFGQIFLTFQRIVLPSHAGSNHPRHLTTNAQNIRNY
jgi:hypothetical protein